mmetsp:Transcript_6688/g.18128  ORF Transcript_6688/g.18128 Transcript_6688/m.18128 type:complete len:384 (+) Transcript_6688:1848-2999(+)
MTPPSSSSLSAPMRTARIFALVTGEKSSRVGARPAGEPRRAPRERAKSSAACAPPTTPPPTVCARVGIAGGGIAAASAVCCALCATDCAPVLAATALFITVLGPCSRAAVNGDADAPPRVNALGLAPFISLCWTACAIAVCMAPSREPEPSTERSQLCGESAGFLDPAFESKAFVAGAATTGEAAAAAAASAAAVAFSACFASIVASVSARSFILRAAPVTDRVLAWTDLGDLASLNADPSDPSDPSELGAPPELRSSAACAGVNFPTPAPATVGGGMSGTSAAAAIFLSAESPPGVHTGGRSWPVMGIADECARWLAKRCDAPSSLSGVWKMLASKPFLLTPSGVAPPAPAIASLKKESSAPCERSWGNCASSTGGRGNTSC